jgi:hypothetical protein
VGTAIAVTRHDGRDSTDVRYTTICSYLARILEKALMAHMGA